MYGVRLGILGSPSLIRKCHQSSAGCIVAVLASVIGGSGLTSLLARKGVQRLQHQMHPTPNKLRLNGAKQAASAAGRPGQAPLAELSLHTSQPHPVLRQQQTAAGRG